MPRTNRSLLLAPLLLGPVLQAATPPAASRPPNIILIMADDLGYAELGCYGQEKIRTPHIDRMAREGMRFTQFYSGSPLCAPTRCTLMTGMHTGHSYIRDNGEVKPEGQRPIPDETITVAEVMKEAGYATGMMGKWGLGGPGTVGEPNRQGFDHWFGYLCQRQAHNHYPRYLWKNGERQPLEGNDRGLTGEQFSQDLFTEEALGFIRENQEQPFFLYLPFAIPHLAIQVPDDSLAEYEGLWDDPPYEGGKGYLPHPAPRAGYAAMITRMDRDVGRILDLLSELDLDDDTIVLFTSDNGPTYNRLGGSDSDFFASAGPFRGLKGSVYEGGIRVPLVARWPGHISAGEESAHIGALWDMLPTFAELAGVEAPDGIDGVSMARALLGQEGQEEHDYLYWELRSYSGQQAVRTGNWKGVRRQMKQGSDRIELYDLAADIGESQDVAEAHPDLVARIEWIMREGRTPSEQFPLKWKQKPKKNKNKKN